MSVYFIINQDNKHIKIGQSSKPLERLSSLQVGNSADLVLLATTDDYTEEELHQRFASYRLHNEWFKPGEKLVKFIKTIAQDYKPPTRKYRQRIFVTLPSNWREFPSLTANKILKVIRLFGPISHYKLHRMLSSRIKAKDLREILCTLEDKGYISSEYMQKTKYRGAKYYKIQQNH